MNNMRKHERHEAIRTLDKIEDEYVVAKQHKSEVLSMKKKEGKESFGQVLISKGPENAVFFCEQNIFPQTSFW